MSQNGGSPLGAAMAGSKEVFLPVSYEETLNQLLRENPMGPEEPCMECPNPARCESFPCKEEVEFLIKLD
jgi:hypothetical protein